jgi:hypothetical protein
VQTYRVLMKGLQRGVPPEDAEPLLAATFHIDVGQVRALMAQLPAKVKSAVAYDRAMEYRRAIERAGGDCVVEADPAPCEPEEAPVLRTTSGHSVIEDGVTLSRFDYERPDSMDGGRLRQLASWLTAHVRLVHPR